MFKFLSETQEINIMIISCGKSNQQKSKEYKEYLEQVAKWHDYFIVWLRHIDNKNGRKRCACLQTVERKITRTTYVADLTLNHLKTQYRFKNED